MSGWAIGGLVRALACYVFCIGLDIYIQINIRNTNQLSWAMCYVRVCHWCAGPGIGKPDRFITSPHSGPLPKMGTLTQPKMGPYWPKIWHCCRPHIWYYTCSRLTTTWKKIFSSASGDIVAKRSHWSEEKTIFPEKRKLDVFSEVSNLLLTEERPFQSPQKLDLFLTDF